MQFEDITDKVSHSSASSDQPQQISYEEVYSNHPSPCIRLAYSKNLGKDAFSLLSVFLYGDDSAKKRISQVFPIGVSAKTPDSLIDYLMSIDANRLKKIIRGSLIGLFSAVLSLVLWFTGILDVFEAKTWDWRQRLLAGPGSASDEIAVILLDQASLDWGKNVNGLPWPWRLRSGIPAGLPRFLRRDGPECIG